MSCFIMSQKSTAALADFISGLCNMGYTFFGFESPGTLNSALLECRDKYGFMDEGTVYSTLRRMNIDAYIARYKKYEWPFSPDVYEPHALHKRAEYESGFYKIQEWHFCILKKLDCYLYQCTEGDVYKKPLYTGLQDLRNCLLGFIARNNPVYSACEWG